jgi:cytochrome c
VDSFEWNKIAGWALAACVSVLALSIGTGIAFKPHPLKEQSYVIEGVEAEGAAAGPAKVADKPVEFYLASASAERGAEIFKKCAACHTITQGGPAGIGPNLYGVLGGPHAHMQGFGYSDAMAATHDKKWDFTAINAWLTSPKAYIPGNKMAFAGISKPEDRAAVIVYVNSQSASPLPLPPVPAETAPAAPAAGAAAPAAAAAAAPAAK